MTPSDRAEPPLGKGSLWLLRIGAVVFVGVLAFFVVDAIIG